VTVIFSGGGSQREPPTLWTHILSFKCYKYSIFSSVSLFIHHDNDKEQAPGGGIKHHIVDSVNKRYSFSEMLYIMDNFGIKLCIKSLFNKCLLLHGIQSANKQSNKNG
jgi:hypothetical protein